LRVTQHLKQVSTLEDDRVSGQQLVRSSYMDVRLLSKLIKNRTYYFIQLIGHSVVLSLFSIEIYIEKSPSTSTHEDEGVSGQHLVRS